MRLTEANKIRLLGWGYYLEDLGRCRDEKNNIDPVGIDLVRRLGPDHEFHHNAVRRWQEWFHADLDEECYHEHGRLAIIDGDVGPATDAVMRRPRCPERDIQPAEAEQANWPEECRMELTYSHPQGMTLPGLDAKQVLDGARQALDNAEADFELKVRIELQSYPNTSVNRKPARLGGSVLADQYLATNRCDYTSNGRIDSDRTWEYWYYVTVISHENGHAYGMPHHRDPSGLLYPSINRASVTRRGRFNETDKRVMRSLGYRDRVTPPTPDPPSDPEIGFGSLKIGDKTYQLIAHPS